jgi:glycosyltransferase involved in cell wall biosynthesis
MIQLTPGSGNTFYCENCLRDGIMVQALHRAGQDIVMVPMYLPLSSDASESVECSPLFFGGVNVYLQQKFRLFGKTPRWLDALFDNPHLLNRVCKFAGMTRAKDLGPMTVSMLAGPRGRQAKEVQRLVDFFGQVENKPDVVILSNLLLAGLARPIKERLGCKLVCWLQDEDGFIEALGQPWSRQAWDLIAERLSLFDLFMPVSHYYAKVMRERLSIPPQKMLVLAPGIDVSRYEQAAAGPQVPTIGFLGRMCKDNGLDILQEAFCRITDGSSDFSKGIRLLVCGGKTSADKQFIEQIAVAFGADKVKGQVEFLEDFDFNARRDFLGRLTVLCSPSRQPPAYAMNVLEAMGCGVPFVAPRIGVYPEWAELTGAGVLYEPNTPDELEKTLRALLENVNKVKELGKNGQQAVLTHFDSEKNAAVFAARLQEC